MEPYVGSDDDDDDDDESGDSDDYSEAGEVPNQMMRPLYLLVLLQEMKFMCLMSK